MGKDLVDFMDNRAYNKWMLTRTLWPKICCLSGKRIPMYSKAYFKMDGPVERWALEEEFIFARIKGDI